MSKLLEYSIHEIYAKIRETSKYRTQHDGFFIVKQHKDIERQGIWIGNDNYYPESEIRLYEYKKKLGFYQFLYILYDSKPLNYSIHDLKAIGLEFPELIDTKWRNDC